MDIIDRLRQFRATSTKSDLDLELEIGLSNGQLQRLISGEVKRPQRSTLSKVRNFLDKLDNNEEIGKPKESPLNYSSAVSRYKELVELQKVLAIRLQMIESEKKILRDEFGEDLIALE